MISKTSIVFLVVAVSVASASHLLAPAGPLLAAPAPIVAGPVLAAPAPILHHHSTILSAPAVVGHAPVLVGHAPVATSTHIAAPIAHQVISRPVATYSTTHTLLGAPLAAPALLARPAVHLAAPAFAAPYGAPLLGAPALPLAAPAILARPAFLKA